MVPDPSKSCLGLEYFCFEGDDLWTMADEDLIKLGAKEIGELGLVDPKLVEDGSIVRMVNLIENALKYGRPETGGLELLLSAREEKGRVLLTVTDNGPGIPEKDHVGRMPELFSLALERRHRLWVGMTRPAERALCVTASS